jgi:hypothetical protein
MAVMDYQNIRRIRDILKDRNIELIGADPATQHGFTQVPNFILTKEGVSVGAKLAYAMLLKYAWGDDGCSPDKPNWRKTWERGNAAFAHTSRSLRLGAS